MLRNQSVNDMENKQYISSRFLIFRQFAREPFTHGFLSLLFTGTQILFGFLGWIFYKKHITTFYERAIEKVPRLSAISSLPGQIAVSAIVPAFWFYGLRRTVSGGKVPYRLRRKADLKGKIIFITGGHGGIGYETTKQCLLWGATVWLGCRDPKKITTIVDRLKVETQNPNIETFQLELEDLESCKTCAESLKAKNKQIDYLVLNAGVAMPPFGKTKQGYETQFGVNHLGHFCLTYNLLENIQKWNTRVIVLASLAHAMVSIRYEGSYPFDLKDDIINITAEKYSPAHSYNISKICNMLFAYSLNQIFNDNKETTCKVVSVHPGAVRTDLERHVRKTVNNLALDFINTFLFKTSEQGAQTNLYCIIEELDRLEGGAYHCDCKAVPPVAEAMNPVMAKKLWDESVKMCDGFV